MTAERTVNTAALRRAAPNRPGTRPPAGEGLRATMSPPIVPPAIPRYARLMSTRYFATARSEIEPYLPARVERMLDLGCGAGATTAFVKAKRPVAWAGGVEIMPDEARAAEAVCDRVWCGSIETLRLEDAIAPASLDLLLCLDVLEHLADPWSVVRKLSPLLRPGGRLIVSIPNIRHAKFIWRLLTRGDFRYTDAGLLDRTHLRFFVRDTAIALATSGGLRLAHAGNMHPWKPSDARNLLSKATLGTLDDLMIKQFAIVAEAV
jgi:2-polyprenyl-3-methyl-5-hydroxy-6-metoxy-1,4-benzoquinol methylase